MALDVSANNSVQLDSYHQPVFIMQDLLLQMKKGRSLVKLLGTELTAFLVMNKLPEKYTSAYSQNHLGLTYGLFPKEQM